MSKPSFGKAKTMPIQGSGCGIRPTQEALEVDYAIDFSAATQWLASSSEGDDHSDTDPNESLESQNPTTNLHNKAK